MAAHFAKIAVVADVIADAIFVDVYVLLWFACEGLGDFESFKDRAAVIFHAAEVVHFCDSRCCNELFHESSHVFAVNVVANLFAFIAKDTVLAAFQVALYQIAKEAV